jgi:tetratricopeptide (TPR) repeat protein
VLLFPGVLVAAALVILLPKRDLFRQRDFVFLLVLLLFTLIAAFIFDPKLGMPRDWDLFSFFGFPLVLFGYYFMVRSRAVIKGSSQAAGLCVALGLFSLAPRVIAQTSPDIALTQVYSYSQLDLKRSMFLFQRIHGYYWERGQYERSPLLSLDWESLFPELGLITRSMELREQGQRSEAARLLERAVEHNPLFAPSYCNLGSCYLELGQIDRALAVLEIAEGLNPHSVGMLNDLGYAYLRAGRMADAAECWKRALAIDDRYMPVRLKLLDYYAATGNEQQYFQLLVSTAESEEAPASVHKVLGDWYLDQGSTERAAMQYRRALEKGLDSTELNGVWQRIP